jgi:hypothetical protein
MSGLLLGHMSLMIWLLGSFSRRLNQRRCSWRNVQNAMGSCDRYEKQTLLSDCVKGAEIIVCYSHASKGGQTRTSTPQPRILSATTTASNLTKNQPTRRIMLELGLRHENCFNVARNHVSTFVSTLQYRHLLCSDALRYPSLTTIFAPYTLRPGRARRSPSSSPPDPTATTVHSWS